MLVRHRTSDGYFDMGCSIIEKFLCTFLSHVHIYAVLFG